MKIAILTIQHDNYGNRLQNYALQLTAERLGHEVVSLRRDGGCRGYAKYRMRESEAACWLMSHKSQRRAAFWAFDRNFVTFSSKVVSEQGVSRDLANSFDCFIIGSDQVWNPEFGFNGELVYLPMIPAEKKISYAASFGVPEITENVERTAELLGGVGMISVRETAGADIVCKLTGRDAAVVLDPTLLLGPDEWEAIARKPGKVDCDRPYVFKYVLGNDVNEKQIEQMAKARGLRIIDVTDSVLPIGPSEFVWLVAHSELVCTDSFHASVFALLHHKPLAIFEREGDDADMSSRFDTLCSSFGLVGHRSSEESFGDAAVYGVDWNMFESRLMDLRASSWEWLMNAIGGVALG